MAKDFWNRQVFTTFLNIIREKANLAFEDKALCRKSPLSRKRLFEILCTWFPDNVEFPYSLGRFYLLIALVKFNTFIFQNINEKTFLSWRKSTFLIAMYGYSREALLIVKFVKGRIKYLYDQHRTRQFKGSRVWVEAILTKVATLIKYFWLDLSYLLL